MKILIINNVTKYKDSISNDEIINNLNIAPTKEKSNDEIVPINNRLTNMKMIEGKEIKILNI